MSRKLDKKIVEFNERREQMGLKPVSRREFLRIAAMAAAGFSLPLSHSCTDGRATGGSGRASREISDVGTDGDDVHSDSGAVGTPGAASVGISRDADVITNVRTAIDLAGGLTEIVGGDTVVIKPNLTGPLAPMCTSPQVLRGVIQAVKTCTRADKIILAECTSLGTSTATYASLAGYTTLIEDEGISSVWWDEQSYVGFRDERWQYITEEKRVPIMLDPTAPQYDHFINVPILKNHQDCANSNAVFTACIKLLVGVLPYNGAGGRMTPSPFGIHDANLGEQAAELHCIVPKKVMNVIDAVTCVVANGPAGGDNKSVLGDQDGPMITADAGLIIASSDVAACDSVGLAVLKYYANALGEVNRTGPMKYVDRSVWADAQIKHIGKLGLGTVDPSLITIVDSGVENIDAIKAQWV